MCSGAKWVNKKLPNIYLPGANNLEEVLGNIVQGAIGYPDPTVRIT